MIYAIQEVLTNDAEINGYLGGGIHIDETLSRARIPDAYDSRGRLKATAIIREESAIELPTPHRDVERQFVVIGFYGPDRADLLAARQRARELLHRQQIQPVGGGNFETRWADHTPLMEDPDTHDLMTTSRYYCTNSM